MNFFENRICVSTMDICFRYKISKKLTEANMSKLTQIPAQPMLT